MTNIEELKEFGLEISEDMKEGKVIVDIYTTWCGPCRTFSPILEKLSQEGLIKLIKEDLEKNRPLGEKCGITSIPTLLLFNNGKLINHPIECEGYLYSRNGIMVGSTSERIMREIIEKM